VGDLVGSFDYFWWRFAASFGGYLLQVEFRKMQQISAVLDSLLSLCATSFYGSLIEIELKFSNILMPTLLQVSTKVPRQLENFAANWTASSSQVHTQSKLKVLMNFPTTNRKISPQIQTNFSSKTSTKTSNPPTKG
jgi:hypothetical protein